MRAKWQLHRWAGVVAGLAAGMWKGAEMKTQSGAETHPKMEDAQARLQEADAVGIFRLSYVDCLPYTGPEQIISIEQDGVIECRDRELGRLKKGSLLKGEVQLVPGFQSRAKNTGEKLTDAQIRVVSLPGGPGVWIAMRSESGGMNRNWDEVYVRLNREKGVEVLT